MSGESDGPTPLTWAAAILAVLVVIGGQWLWQSGSRLGGGVVTAVGGLALAGIIARVALTGLPKRRKRP